SADTAGRALRQALADGRGLVELDDGTLAVPLRAGGELFGAVAVTGTNGRTPENQRAALVAHAADPPAPLIPRPRLPHRHRPAPCAPTCSPSGGRSCRGSASPRTSARAATAWRWAATGTT